MSRAYSNKALPAGTVLREWRLEEVLGVGGFGIVYKARGIYFNELVAIKEYFPSSISERDEDDTVVPIDSDSEEVHALGLKKFVEEAKLLWNLSTPTRHPNIVSVRSLFEIHGTAYMVMDFEDGMSLSKMLKQGRRFNERSLWNILRPIADGLDRAHRVGVLHRDIKPPNILINEDNCPVLIDFGSARFEAAEATSTTVTFHTPPYAAIEQYVKTYEQGPWTDVYALGVVMYECVTGEKPPEVLERLHAGLGKPLAAGKWPGYSKKFLAAIDAAMTIKPDERPQSISAWLAMFGKQEDPATDDSDGDDEATRFYATKVGGDAIVPLTRPLDTDQAVLATGVPDDPKEAKFRRAGKDTKPDRKVATKADLPKAAAEEHEAAAATVATPTAANAPGAKKLSAGMLAAAAAAIVVVGGGGGYFLVGGGSSKSVPDAAAGISAPGPDATVTDINALGDTTNLTVNGVEPGPAPPADAAAAADEVQKRAAAKLAAAIARVAAKEKADKKAAEQQAAKAGAPQAGQTTTAGTETASSSREDGESRAKMAQFYAIVDGARAQAKQVMRSKNSQNAQLARTYDANLKTLRDSIRGARSDDEADRLIKQAKQTSAYINFLVKQE